MDLDIIIHPLYRCDGGEDGMRRPMDYKLSKFITTYLEYGFVSAITGTHTMIHHIFVLCTRMHAYARTHTHSISTEN